MYTSTITNAPNSPPIHPSIDLFGLISVNLCFPKCLPIKYANMSVPQDAKNTYHIKILPFIRFSLMTEANTKNKTT